ACEPGSRTAQFQGGRSSTAVRDNVGRDLHSSSAFVAARRWTQSPCATPSLHDRRAETRTLSRHAFGVLGAPEPGSACWAAPPEARRYLAVALSRAACDFFRAAVFRCSAPRDTARSISFTRLRCSASIVSASPSSTAAASRLVSVLIVER